MTLQKDIIKKIERGDIKMKPRFYFVFKASVIILVIIFFVLLSIFLLSFLLFNLSQTGIIHLPRLGIMGMKKFLFSFPWIISLLGLILIILTEVFVKKITYKKPLIFSLVIIVCFVSLSSFLISKTTFHNHLSMRKPPLLGRMYTLKHAKDTTIGKIIEINKQWFKIENKQGVVLTVSTTTKTKFPQNQNLDLHDTVIVIGEEKDFNIEAKIIKVLKCEIMRQKGCSNR